MLINKQFSLQRFPLKENDSDFATEMTKRAIVPKEVIECVGITIKRNKERT